MTYAIHVTPKGYQTFRTLNGIYRLNVGPAFPTPREAIAYSKSLEAVEAADVQPLRASPALRSDPRSLTPSGVGQVERSAGVRELATRLRGQAGE